MMLVPEADLLARRGRSWPKLADNGPSGVEQAIRRSGHPEAVHLPAAFDPTEASQDRAADPESSHSPKHSVSGFAHKMAITRRKAASR